MVEIIKRGKEKVLIEKIGKDGGLSSVINFVLCNTMLWRIAEKCPVTGQACHKLYLLIHYWEKN